VPSDAIPTLLRATPAVAATPQPPAGPGDSVGTQLRPGAGSVAPAPISLAPPPSAPSRPAISPTGCALIGVGALLAVALVFVGVALLDRREQRSADASPPPDRAPTAVAASAATVAAPVANSPLAPSIAPMVLPDADAHGFTTYHGGARCTGADRAAMVLRTAQSALVVCRSSTGSLYYLGYRMSDGATIRLDTVYPAEDSGFLAINAPDSAQYQINSTGLQIIQNGAVIANESAVEAAQ
jgi:serine/threonine-protein kinase